MIHVNHSKVPEGQKSGGWCNKCAALLHMDLKGHMELLSEQMERLRQHPGVKDALKKVDRRYNELGTAVCKQYI